jgi:tetratricopeptide (TPR) repeat protein
MYKLFILILCLSANTAFSQQHEDMVALIYQHKPHNVLSLGRTYLSKDNGDASAYELTGQAYYELHNYDSAVYYLQKSLDLDKGKTLISCWAHINLGKYYYIRGERDKAKSELEQSITKKATDKMKNFSRYLLRTMGMDDYYNNWFTAATEHIVFHFQDTLQLPNYREYMAAHEMAYATINENFKANLPKKLDFFSWNDKEQAKEFLLKSIGFTEPHLCITHAHNAQTKGHEITHSLVYWGWDTISLNRNRLINEGIAVAFDLAMVDKLSMARKSIENLYIGDIRNIWISPTHYSDEVLYPLAGALVTYLRGKSSPDQFRQLVKNQDLESAKQIYGPAFDGMMDEFNKLVGIK